MIFKILSASFSLLLALWAFVNMVQKPRNRALNAVVVVFWLTVALFILDDRLKFAVGRSLGAARPTDVFVHGAILIGAYALIRVFYRLGQLRAEVRELCKAQAILKGELDHYKSGTP